MNPNEKEFRLLMERYKAGEVAVFNKIWQKARNLINIGKYKDPTKVRTYHDFESIARNKCWECLFSDKKVVWVPNRGYTALSWVRNCMVRAILKEIKQIKRTESRTELVPEEGETFEECLCRKSGHSYNPNLEFMDDEVVQEYIIKIDTRLQRENSNLRKTFHLRLAFPNIKIKMMSKTVGVSEAQIYHYLSVLKRLTKEVIKRHGDLRD